MSEGNGKQFSQGQVFREEFTADSELVGAFAEFSRDFNPVHLEAEAAREYGHARPFAHGAILSAVLSRIIGMKVPGPGAVWMNQNMEWLKPVYLGDRITVEVTIAKYSRGAGIFELEIVSHNQKQEIVMEGSAKVKQGKKMSGEKKRESCGRRVAMVTGGSRGIGAAIAKALGASGIDVAVVYKQSQSGASSVVNEIAAGGSVKAASFQAELTNSAQLEKLLLAVTKEMGEPDIVVHAATPPITHQAVDEMEKAELQKYLDMYLMVAHDLVKLTAPAMVERHFGRYVFLGTSYLYHPVKKMAAYMTAKYALLGYMRSVAFEMGAAGITANMISPSMAITDLTEDIPARIKEMEAAKSSLRRLVGLEEIAGTATFLVGEAGGYLNGVNLPLTGGPV